MKTSAVFNYHRRVWILVFMASLLLGMILNIPSLQTNLMLWFGILLVIIAILKIEYGIYSLLCFSALAGLWGFDILGLPPIYFVEIMLAILMLASVFVYRRKLVSSPVNKPVILIIIWAVIAMIGSVYVGTVNFEPICYKNQINSFIMLLLTVVSYFVIANNISSKQAAKYMVFSIIIANLLLNIWQYYAFFTKGTMEIGYTERVGSFGGWSYGGLYMIAVLLLLSLLFYYKDRLRRSICIFLICIIGFGMVTSFNRSTLIATAISILLLAFLKKKRTFIVLLLCLLIAFLAYPKLIQPIVRTYDPNIIPWVRLPMAQDAMRIIKENPIFGIGLDRYWHHSNYRTVYKTEQGRWEYYTCSAHNDYLQMASNMGIPGLALFIWFLYVIWKETFALYKSTKDEFSKTISLTFLVTIVGFSIQCLTAEAIFGCYGNGGYWGLSVRLYFWALLGIVIGLKNLEKKENNLLS